MNRKNGSDATVDIREMKKGDPVETFIIQVAALSWAATQVPEIIVAIQSLLKSRFLDAVQQELAFMRVFKPLQRQFRLRVSEYFVPKPAMSKASFCAAIKSAREQKSVSQNIGDAAFRTTFFVN